MKKNSNKNKLHPNTLIEEWLEKINQGVKKMANEKHNQKKMTSKTHIPNDTTVRAIKESRANLAAFRAQKNCK